MFLGNAQHFHHRAAEDIRTRCIASFDFIVVNQLNGAGNLVGYLQNQLMVTVGEWLILPISLERHSANGRFAHLQTDADATGRRLPFEVNSMLGETFRHLRRPINAEIFLRQQKMFDFQAAWVGQFLATHAIFIQQARFYSTAFRIPQKEDKMRRLHEQINLSIHFIEQFR